MHKFAHRMVNSMAPKTDRKCSGHSLFSIFFTLDMTSTPGVEFFTQNRSTNSNRTMQLWKSTNGNRSEKGVPPRGRHPRNVDHPAVGTPSEGVMNALLTRNLDMIEPALSKKLGLVGQEQTEESNSQSDSLLFHPQPKEFINAD